MLALHTFVTLFMCGLIWTIQLLHYPLFLKIQSETFTEYERLHQKKISFLVVPVMIAELATCAILLFQEPSFLPLHLNYLNAGLLFIIWASTFLIQVPLHNKLSRGFNAEAIHQLVRSNWIRTFAWTARAILLTWSLFNILGGTNNA